MGEHLIADLESDGLVAEATKLHTIQIGTLEDNDCTIYCDALPGYPSLSEGLVRLAAAERVIGHNFLTFDYPLLEKLYPGTLRRAQVQDTLIMARLMTPEERSNSLQNWGERLGILKGSFKGPWDVCTPEMVEYARQDVVVGRAVYEATKETETWGESLALEHQVAWAMFLQEGNGFGLDVPAAQELDATLRGELADLNAQLQIAFPPLTRSKTVTPKANNSKYGNVKGVQKTTTWLEAFNPASRPHVAERLQLAGWKPTEFGADGIPTVDEKTLSSMKYPEAKLIVAYFKAGKKIGMLSDGKNGWLKLVRNGRLHGRVNPNGACTGRMTHRQPNMAQVDSDPRMRALFVPRPGWTLVGCDAEGLEARCLAHYLTRYDGGAYTEMLLNGKKEDGTDVHSANRNAINRMGFDITRDGAKTALYALMFGAGPYKLGTTVIQDMRDHGKTPPRIPPVEAGKLVQRAIAKSMRGIDKLTADLRAAAKSRGFLVGLDGRRLFVRSEHSILNTICQSAGAVVMKTAIRLFFDDYGDTHGRLWGLCGSIHDELQMETESIRAEGLGTAFATCIVKAGEHLKLRCPLAGSASVGANWSLTH